MAKLPLSHARPFSSLPKWYNMFLPLPLMLIIALVLLLRFLPNRTASGTASGIDSPGIVQDNIQRRQEIESAFQFAWDGYRQFAFPHDELKPVSNTPGTSRNDWGATVVDALGTAILMENTNVVNAALDHVNTIDFTQTKDVISVFESTIRYIGGMLSAYELLHGPFAHLKVDPMRRDALLIRSKELADGLMHGFDYILPSGELEPGSFRGKGKNSLAGAGTLVLEWTKLSDLIGIDRYANLTQHAEDLLLRPSPASAEVFPGLVGNKLSIETNQFSPSTISWGGSSDSFYEYLIKMYVFDPQNFSFYKDRWILAADSTINYLASSPRNRTDLVFLGQYDAESDSLVPESGHMECFAAGNFLLGGMVLDNTTYTDFGLKLVDSCRHLYVSTATKIGSETFRWLPSECDETSPRWQCDPSPPEKEEFHKQHDFWITESSYNLRPEVIESYYYAYRITQNQKYRDWAWGAWKAINATARLEHGFNYLRDVDVEGGKKREGNNQESYFFSETLKYLFLIFSPEGEWHVNDGGKNTWVYNTEGHPLRVRSQPSK